MKAVEIRELSVEDLKERIAAEKVKLNTTKLENAVSPVENPTTLNKARKDIARLMTILREKQK